MDDDMKMQRMMELLTELNELFPEMDKMIINDPVEPDYIIMTTTEYINTMAEAFGLEDDLEEIASEYPDIPKKDDKKSKLQ